jgi:hypothetical protein
MGVREFFNKAAKGVKTLFKKDGLVSSTFNKGSALFDKGSAMFDKGIGAALNIGGQIGRTARDLAPALGGLNPELGAAAYGIGTAIDKGTGYLSRIANKKNEITGKINEVRNKLNPILLPKPMIEEEPQEIINFA